MGIDVRKLTYVYNPGTPFETKAVDDVSFEIKDGEFVGIIGHTGSGKSTLIQHLNALIEPTSGSVYVDGEDINASKNRVALRRRVGLVFQYPEYQLFEETVLKDVCYGPKNLGFSKEEQEEKARAALAAVGASEELFEKSPFEISGGEKRRVAIAGVLAMEPEVLILDEPTAGLDPLGKSQLLELLKKYHEEKHVAIILVSHSMEEVAQYADRVIAMSKSKIVLDGSTEDVFAHRAELEEIGLGVPEVCAFTQSIGLGDVLTVEEAAEKIMQVYGNV